MRYTSEILQKCLHLRNEIANSFKSIIFNAKACDFMFLASILWSWIWHSKELTFSITLQLQSKLFRQICRFQFHEFFFVDLFRYEIRISFICRHGFKVINTSIHIGFENDNILMLNCNDNLKNSQLLRYSSTRVGVIPRKMRKNLKKFVAT